MRGAGPAIDADADADADDVVGLCRSTRRFAAPKLAGVVVTAFGYYALVTYVSLPVDVRSVASARALLKRKLARHTVGADTAASAALMLSELVTNAIRHTRRLLLLDIIVRGKSLHVAVIDDAPGRPVARPDDDEATSGRGLTIVDAIADRWGSIPGIGCKTVWFEISLP
jgi:anti-sigma regulatory factor (Ser/Thr protein kinase)